MPTRTERQRDSLVRDVKDAALEQLRDVGAEALSLRAIARDVDMSPAGLYRYFDGRDAILTALIEEGFDDLADHLFHAIGLSELVTARHGRIAPGGPTEAADARPRARQAAAGRTYRRWALDHPNEFGLLYGDPVRGYAAPQGGVTVTANGRVAHALLTPMVEAHLDGGLRVSDHFDALATDSAGRRLVDDIRQIAGVDVDASTALRTMGAWARLHGFVALEVFNQLRWLYPHGAGALFEAELASQLDDLFGSD